jgi:hypothetical protein
MREVSGVIGFLAGAAARLAGGHPEPDPGPGNLEEQLEWRLEHYKSLAVMCLHRTFEGRMTFSKAEQELQGDLSRFSVTETRHPDGSLEVAVALRRPG